MPLVPSAKRQSNERARAELAASAEPSCDAPSGRVRTRIRHPPLSMPATSPPDQPAAPVPKSGHFVAIAGASQVARDLLYEARRPNLLRDDISAARRRFQAFRIPTTLPAAPRDRHASCFPVRRTTNGASPAAAGPRVSSSSQAMALAGGHQHAELTGGRPRKRSSKQLDQGDSMPQPERFEILVLGGGNGGMYLAWHMARSGRRTAVVERRWIGGSCPNINCLPSKNEIWSAKVADLTRHAARFGAMTGPVAIDMVRVRQRKREMVEGMIALALQEYKASGAELIMGSGRFVAPKTLEVELNDGGTRVLVGDRIFVNIGTHAAIPSVRGLEAAEPLTNIEALELDRLPSHLVVLGGGYVDLEMAQAYLRFGSRVTIIEQGPQDGRPAVPDVADLM